MRNLIRLLLALTAATGAALLLSAFAGPAGAATGLAVSVGYADDLHGIPPSGTPTPWQGAPNTNFIGTGSPWDAGAIKLDNPFDTDVTVNDVSVRLPASGNRTEDVVFDLWGSFTVPAHGSAILTQTVGAPDCEFECPSFNFDTSDHPVVDCGGFPTGGAPEVTVTVGETSTTLVDTGRILDTGGFDPASCDPAQGEFRQWTALGGFGDVSGVQVVPCPSDTGCTASNGGASPGNPTAYDIVVPPGYNTGTLTVILAMVPGFCGGNCIGSVVTDFPPMATDPPPIDVTLIYDKSISGKIGVDHAKVYKQSDATPPFLVPDCSTSNSGHKSGAPPCVLQKKRTEKGALFIRALQAPNEPGWGTGG